MQPRDWESYREFTQHLTEARASPPRLVELLAAAEEGGQLWLAAAYCELRALLERGQIVDSEELGVLIEAVLRARASSSGEAEDEAEQHATALRALISGIGSVLNGDLGAARGALEPLYLAESMPASVRWVATIWLSSTDLEAGDRRSALGRARDALEIASSIDEQTRAASLVKLADLYHTAGLDQRALGYLEQAQQAFRDAGETRGLARAHLQKSRILACAGEVEQATEELDLAEEAAPSWEEPRLLRAWQALCFGQAETARALAEQLKGRKSAQERGLIIELAQLLQEGAASRDEVHELVRLRQLPPSTQNNESLELLARGNPRLPHARELLAWRLLRAGQTQEAEEHFGALNQLPLSQDLKASVVLGLGLVAKRRSLSQEPGAQLFAAKAAGYEAMVAPAQPEPSGAEPAVPPASGATHAAEDEIEIEIDIDVFDDEPSSPRPSPQFGAGFAFDGDLQHFRVSDLVDFLYRSRRSGSLVITSAVGIGAMHLRRGNITSATSPSCANLGDLLLEEGAISRQQLTEAAELQQEGSSPPLLGAIFVERFAIEVEQIKRVLRVQIQRAMRELMAWTHGRFAFEPEPAEAGRTRGGIDIEVDALSILLDAARRRDEENR